MEELSAHINLPDEVGAPAAARRSAESMLRSWGLVDATWLAQAMVVISELVTNAVRHGGGIIGLDVHRVANRVVVSAIDHSTDLPRRRNPGDDGGRGVALIEAFSVRWGVDDQIEGKRVWAELAPYPDPPLSLAAGGSIGITEHELEDEVVLALDGGLDLGTVDQLEEAVNTAIASSPRQITIDLYSLTFCDSTGVGALVACHAAARNNGVLLRVSNANGLVRRTLVTTGVYRLLAED